MAKVHDDVSASDDLSQTITSSEQREIFNYKDFQGNLGQADLIRSGTKSTLGEVLLGINAGMTSFNYFIEHGDMKFQGPLNAVTIDFEKKDALNEALQSAFQETYDIVKSSTEYKTLISEKEPTLKQRYAYEQVLAHAAFDAIEDTPGLHQYRLDQASNSFDSPGTFKTSNNFFPDNDLNKLSDDIDVPNNRGRQYNWGLECEKMSALKGLIMQSVENDLLAPDNGSFNSAGNYFNALGYVSQVSGFSASVLKKDDFSVSRNGHAYITSSKSGAIFEATTNTTVSKTSEYAEDKSGRLLIPILGTLSTQTEVNENFELLASGAKVYYAPMDPQAPGRMAQGKSVTDLHAYQVGSTEDMAIERLNAIYSGDFEKLSDLTSGHVWDDAAEKAFKSEIKDYEIFYRAYEQRRIMELLLHKYDPNNLGPEQVIIDIAKDSKFSLDSIPKSINEAYQTYYKQGKEIPKELLIEISANPTGQDSLISVGISLHSITSGHEKQRQDLSKLKQGIVQAGHSPYIVSPMDNFLKSDRVNNIKSAYDIVQSMLNIYAQAEELSAAPQHKTKPASLKI